MLPQPYPRWASASSSKPAITAATVPLRDWKGRQCDDAAWCAYAPSDRLSDPSPLSGLSPAGGSTLHLAAGAMQSVNTHGARPNGTLSYPLVADVSDCATWRQWTFRRRARFLMVAARIGQPDSGVRVTHPVGGSGPRRHAAHMPSIRDKSCRCGQARLRLAAVAAGVFEEGSALGILLAITAALISLYRSGLSHRNCLTFSRPCPKRTPL